jgi:hypothetical protein
MHIPEVTDCSGIGHLTVCILYVGDTTINENMLSWKPVKKEQQQKTLQNV